MIFTRMATLVSLLMSVAWLTANPAIAQAFNSGSTGALGALNPPTGTTTITLPSDGVLHYTTINIPSGATVQFQRNSANTPVTMLATGDVTIAGTIQVNGEPAGPASQVGTAVIPGGLGGPGGSAGGPGGSKGMTNTDGTSAPGPGGGAGGRYPGVTTGDGVYGADSSFVSLVPLFGGSGGGGGVGSTMLWGTSGAGGGGAIVIASTTQMTITSTGAIRANGGTGNIAATGYCNWFAGGAGSGGAIRLVAPQLTNQGTVQALNGPLFCPTGGGPGRIRLECTTCAVGTTTPAASVTTTLGPITAASTPPLINVPTLTMSTVGGLAVPPTPAGMYTTADVSLPAGSSNPVPITLTATNTPVGTVFTVKVIPQSGTEQLFVTPPSTGSLASSSATALVSLPPNQIALLYAFASFPLTASGFPLVDGELVDRILVAAASGHPSTVTFLTRSGKEVPAQ